MVEDDCKKCCINCVFFEARTGFCRLDSPKVIPQYIKNIGQVNSAIWPKIPMPELDWCGKFKAKQDKRLI